MATLTGKQVKETYKDLLTVNAVTDNQGLESALKGIMDGEGTASALSLSTTQIGVKGNFLTDTITEYVFRTDSSATGDIFSIEVGVGNAVFSMDKDGILVLNEQSTPIPSPIEGGVYYDGDNLYFGIKD